MGTMSPRLDTKEQGPTMSRPTRPKEMSHDAHNRGGLEITIESNLVNRASRDRVRVRYYHN
jgi:hypothetical protein